MLPVLRVSVRNLAVAVVGAAVLVTLTVADRVGAPLWSGSLVSSVEAQGVCARPSMGTENAILTGAEAFIINSEFLDAFGSARLQRVEGEWARVVVVPRIMTDHARILLQREASGRWTVVAGPGTGFAPDDVPGAPHAIFESCPA